MSNLRTEYHSRREECARLGSTAEKRAALEAQVAELARDSERVQAQVAATQAERKPLEKKKAQLTE